MARVLVVSDLWPPFPGGAERLMFNLARELMRRGADVTVLTGYGPALQLDGPPVLIRDLGVRANHADGAEVLAAVLDAMQPDVLLVHHFYAYEFEAELVASGIPMVQVVLNTRRIPEASLAVFISQYVADRAGFLPGDLVILPPVFDDVIAATHGDAIGFIKPYPHKGAELVYRIAAAMPDRRFVVLRGEWPSEERIVEDLPNVAHLAPVDDMRDFYRQVRLMLMPSLSEDAGTVAQEATANGLPCISSDRGGLVETNAGGIQLSPEPEGMGAWVAAIRYLDDDDHYRNAVRSQQAALDAHHQADRMDELAARIAAL